MNFFLATTGTQHHNKTKILPMQILLVMLIIQFFASALVLCHLNLSIINHHPQGGYKKLSPNTRLSDLYSQIPSNPDKYTTDNNNTLEWPIKL